MTNGARAKTISHYELIDQLGTGGMSIVYRARDIRNGDLVALKLLHPALAHNPEGKKRLAREAHVISQLQHPNIVRILNYESDSELFIVTELIEGVTLKEFGEKYTIWKTPEIGALITRQIALALQYAHERNVIHRDIKPENIMVSRNGDIKIMDFGIARLLDEGSLTMTGSMIGSPAHMAPELIEGRECDPRSDVFSLSTVFYWLASGVLPFDGNTPHALLRNILEGRSRSLDEAGANLFPPLKKVIERGLLTRANERFQSAQEFAQAIEEALAPFEAEQTQLPYLLKEPEKQVDYFALQIREASLRQAAQALMGNNFILGTAFLNRVLVDEPENTHALSLLDRLSVERGHKGNALPILVAGIITAGVFATLLFWMLPSEIAPVEPIPRPIPLSAKSVDPQVASLLPVSKAKEKSPAPKKQPTPKTVVTVTPFADIWVDGKKVASDVSRAELELTPGKHKIEFTHDYAATETRVLLVKNGGQNLHVDLERVKPSTLTVTSNIEADISIDGVYKGTTTGSLRRPILITFPDRSHGKRVELIVSRKGFLPNIRAFDIAPGTRQNVSVTLEPG